MAEITLKEFEKQLEWALKQSPNLHQKLLQKSGELVLDEAAKQTPEVEGRLKSSYERKSFKGKQEWEINVDGDAVEAGTNVYYARMVEEGHAKPDGNGFVEGKHYFRKGFEQAENGMGDLSKVFFKQLGKVIGFDIK